MKRMQRGAAVIVTYNNVGMLRDLLEDLCAQSRPVDEIVVVDNASSDGTEHEVRTNYPAVEYVWLSENTGSAGGYLRTRVWNRRLPPVLRFFYWSGLEYSPPGLGGDIPGACRGTSPLC